MPKTVQEKTAALKRVNLPISLLDKNPDNPNVMDDKQFNMLVDNFEQTGFTDPALVRALPNGRYRIVGGHHRVDVAELMGMEEVPCTVIDDPDFTDDLETFQVVRMNVIRGQMTPDKFFAMYEKMKGKYADDVMAEAFGFVEKEEFDKLIAQMSKALPKELQSDFKKAAKEMKTIDGLSKLLNSFFSKYGSTLPFNYMVLDYGDKDSVWVRCKAAQYKTMLDLGKQCIDAGVTLDSVLNEVVAMAMKNQSTLKMALAGADKAEIPAGTELPTEEALATTA